nr:Hint domain-containing protein [uncultured Rhodopila sp.]
MATYTWNAGTAGTWSVGTNWSAYPADWISSAGTLSTYFPTDSLTLNTGYALSLSLLAPSETLSTISVGPGTLTLSSVATASDSLIVSNVNLTGSGNLDVAQQTSGTYQNYLNVGNINAGGTGTIAIGSGTIVTLNSVLRLGGGTVGSGETIQNQGQLQISNTVTLAGTLTTSGSNAGTALIVNGGTLDIEGTASKTAIVSNEAIKFSGTLAQELILGNHTSWSSNDQVQAFGTLDTINFGSATINNVTTAGASGFNINLNDGVSVFLYRPIGYADNSGAFLSISQDIAANPNAWHGASTFAVCFAEGTAIATPAGDVAVEALSIGDMVTNRHGEARAIKWIGYRSLDIAAHPRPETVAPIRILRGAFADAIPYRDLRVSPDHAILVDGKLVCARQLINGTTIYQEETCRSVTYFHVELDSHDILLAEGLTAESYLNTGNVAFFANAGAPVTLHPDLTEIDDYAQRESASVAPFVWDEATVQPIWQGLADRAAALGLSPAALDRTTDPDLQILVKGERISPLHSADGLFVFVLPASTTAVQLCSRASRPTDGKPWLEDRRALGLYMERIVLKEADNSVSDVPLDHPGLVHGWWAPERTGKTMRRWTNGEAVLELPESDSARILEIRASSSGMNYVLAAEDIRRAA